MGRADQASRSRRKRRRQAFEVGLGRVDVLLGRLHGLVDQGEHVVARALCIVRQQERQRGAQAKAWLAGGGGRLTGSRHTA